MEVPFAKQIALGSAAAIVVIATIVGAWFLIPRPLIDPASVLPAGSTVALFQNVDAETIAPYAHAFPILDDVPLSRLPATVAIMKTQTGGQLNWVLLTRTGKTDRPFVMRTSSPAVQSRLSDVTDPLSRSYTYATLLPDDALSPWAYIDFPGMPLSSASKISAIVMPMQPVSVSAGTGSVTVRMLAPSAEERLTDLPAVSPSVFAQPMITIQMQDPGDALLDASGLLPKNDLLAIESVLGTAIRSIFGEGMSPRYDLIPLLHGPTTLQVASGSGTALRVVLAGSIPGSDAQTMLLPLAERFKDTLTAVRRDTQTFDKKFTFTDVEDDPSLISDTGSTRGSWTTRSLTQMQTHDALFLATRGSEFVLSNDEDAFGRMTDAPAPSFPPMQIDAVGLGSVQINALSTLLNRTMPTVWRHPQLSVDTGGTLQWKLTRQGRRLTIEMTRK